MRSQIINYKGITILLLMGFLIGCSNQNEEKDDRLFKVIDEGLQASSIRLDNYNNILLRSFATKVEDPQTKEIAGIWQSKALAIKQFSDDMNVYIEDLKNILKDTKNKSTPNELMDKQGKGVELYKKLEQHKSNLFKIDSGLIDEFQHEYVTTTKEFDLLSQGKNDFTKTFFYNTSKVAATTVLCKFQNNIKIIENDMMTYCHKKISYTGGCNLGESLKFLVMQSSTHVHSGEKVEVTAGLWPFERNKTNPQIIIAGKKVKTDFDGFGVLFIKAPEKLGKHIVPVTINYLAVTGRQETISKNIVYYVDSIPTKQ